jgi:3D (Asp-Asp-Asp) domain-containing protein
MQVQTRSAAATVGQALTDAGIPLVGLDYAVPSAGSPLPADGQIRVVRVVENVVLVQKTLPYSSRSEFTAELELDQQDILQAGEPGLAVSRVRVRSEDGTETARTTEGETVVRPAQDRVLGYGTKIVIRTEVVDGATITYWRKLNVYVTAYSPCASGGAPGQCYTGTSSGLPAGKGVIAMVYSWYLLFGGQNLYVPGYGTGVVGDTGGGAPAGNHYWIDLGYSDGDPAIWSWGRWVTVYFLVPAEANPGYILP